MVKGFQNISPYQVFSEKLGHEESITFCDVASVLQNVKQINLSKLTTHYKIRFYLLIYRSGVKTHHRCGKELKLCSRHVFSVFVINL